MKNLAIMAGFNTILMLISVVVYFSGATLYSIP